MNHQQVYEALQTALDTLRLAKPGDRGEVDRRFAVTITEMEKVVAYFHTYLISELVAQKGNNNV